MTSFPLRFFCISELDQNGVVFLQLSFLFIQLLPLINQLNVLVREVVDSGELRRNGNGGDVVHFRKGIRGNHLIPDRFLLQLQDFWRRRIHFYV